MQKITVPDLMVLDLERVAQGAKLCDSAGRVLGFFVPAIVPAEYETEPDLSDEELARIENSTEWYSTAEVLRHLENLR